MKIQNRPDCTMLVVSLPKEAPDSCCPFKSNGLFQGHKNLNREIDITDFELPTFTLFVLSVILIFSFRKMFKSIYIYFISFYVISESVAPR
jgi:hypothetical protein